MRLPLIRCREVQSVFQEPPVVMTATYSTSSTPRSISRDASWLATPMVASGPVSSGHRIHSRHWGPLPGNLQVKDCSSLLMEFSSKTHVKHCPAQSRAVIVQNLAGSFTTGSYRGAS